MQNHNSRYPEHEEVRKHNSHKEEVALAMCAINHMSYDKPVSSSNVVDRVIQNFPFNPQAYQGVSNSTIATVIFNSGSSIVNAATSSVQFSVNFPNAPSDLVWSWGDIKPTNKTLKSGSSACNLFKEITLKARGGEILQRTINSNVLAAALAPFKKGTGSEYLYAGAGAASMVTSAGANLSNSTFISETFPVYWAADTNYFEIPLGKLASFFGEQAPLPPTLISGLTLSLQFENFLNAMVFYTASNTRSSVGNGASPYSYNTPSAQVLTNVNPTVATPALSLNVANMQLMLDAMTVMDQSLQVINAKASSLASSGLQYDFYGVYHSQNTLTSSAANIDILLSAANLQAVVLSFRKAGQGNGTYDNFARLPLVSYGDAADGTSIFQCDANSVGLLGRSGASVRLRIGSNYLTLTPQFSAAMTYRFTVQSLCDVKNAAVSDVDPLHVVNRPFDQGVSYSDWYAGSGATTIAFDCEKSANLSISGAQTNNSRSVILEIQGANASGAAPILLDIHCLYLNCVNSSLENNILDR
jgi:hypothetical protein